VDLSNARRPNTKARVSFIDSSYLAVQLFDKPSPDLGDDRAERPARRTEQNAATVRSRQNAGSRRKRLKREGVGDNRQPTESNALRQQRGLDDDGVIWKRQVPVVILAIGIFFVFAKLRLLATVTGLVLANVMLGLPYVVTSVLAGLQSFDMAQALVARSLGMNRFRSFMAVTLPQIRASVASGAIFAFISAIDETIIAIFISGGQYQPLTKRHVHIPARRDQSAIAAISTLLTATSFILVLLATSRQK
jgi:hypothetical protein